MLDQGLVRSLDSPILTLDAVAFRDALIPAFIPASVTSEKALPDAAGGITCADSTPTRAP